MSIQLLQGNRAAALGALAAGCRFFAGYPITPSSEIAEIMSRELPKVGGKFIQMEDEIASIAAVIGGSVGGLKSMTATSGPGFSLMQENIGYAAVAEIPCVVINVMRTGPSTGLPTSPAQGDVMQARWGTHGDHPIVALAPASVREAFDLTVKAFNFAEKYRTPVLVLMDEVIGHMRERVDLPDPEAVEIDNREMPTVPPEWYEPFGNPPSDVPPLAPFGEGYRYH
ncbi:MAG: 2-oxoacid:acceptor oxidoreductase subunit alpha, partial [Anaerolineae bacterium]